MQLFTNARRFRKCMGELSAAELAKLMPRWREEYERANDPAFSYCVGQVAGVAKWLKGSAGALSLGRHPA
jgi:hypothetical protein